MLLEMEGGDSVLAALEEFSRKPSDAIPTVLEEYLIRVSKTGETQFPWAKCKILIQRKIDATIKKFNSEMPYDGIATVPNAEVVRFDDMRRNILAAIESFTGAPFTIQRLCELVTDPKRHYTRTDKFLRGLEKNVLVVTTVDPWGRKISSDRSAVRALVVNGMSPSGGQHSSSGGCTPLRSPAAAGPPPQDSAATAALCQVQGDAVVKDDANVPSPAQDSPISNGGSSSSSSSSSSSISSFEGEHADCDDARAADSTRDAGVSNGLPVGQAMDSASVIGVKRPSTDSLFNVKSVPAKQPCQAARLPESDAASGAATCGDGANVAAPALLPSSSSEPVASTVENTCAGADDAAVCVTASTSDGAGSDTPDTRLGASDSGSAESLSLTPACAVTKAGPAEHDSGVISCSKAVSTPRSSAKGDGDSVEAVAAASATVQAATADADGSGSPVDGGDGSGSPSKLCSPATLPPQSSAAPLAAEAALSDST